MNKKFMVLFLITLLFTATFYGCNTKDKEILLSSDIQSDIRDNENEILKYISEGRSYLNDNDFDSARASFERAITKDKSKSSSYLEIKDLYMNAERYDDAYYFVKLAIDNDIDKDNMLSNLEGIKKNFEVVKHDVTVTLNSKYSINEHMNISTPINGVNTDVSFKLDNISSSTAIDTSKENTYSFNTSSYEYGRSAVINVTVRQPVIKKMVGFVTKNYESNGFSYISFDEAEFFRNEIAKEEYAKDFPGSRGPDNSYYLRNNSLSTVDYKISSNCSYSLCAFTLDDYSINSATTLEIKKSVFNNYIANSFKQFISKDTDRSRALLFWITTEDDIITKIEMQFTP